MTPIDPPPFVVCDASKLYSTGRSASVCICSWGVTTVLTHEIGTSVPRAEAIAAAMALENALEALEDPGHDPITVHTDQQWLALDAHSGPAVWKHILQRPAVFDEYLLAMLIESRSAIEDSRLRISWLKSHLPPKSPATRMMRHADALAFLIASGAIDADGQLPRTPDKVFQDRLAAGRDDQFIDEPTRKILAEANTRKHKALQAAIAPAESINELIARSTKNATTKKNSPLRNRSLLLLDLRQAPFVVASTDRRRTVLPRGTTNERALSVALQEAVHIALRDTGSSTSVRICVLGPIPSLKKTIARSTPARRSLEELGLSRTAPIELSPLSRKTALANSELAALLAFAHRNPPKN